MVTTNLFIKLGKQFSETEGLSSGCEASGFREEIARDYAALQTRLGREFSDRRGKLYACEYRYNLRSQTCLPDGQEGSRVVTTIWKFVHFTQEVKKQYPLSMSIRLNNYNLNRKAFKTGTQ